MKRHLIIFFLGFISDTTAQQNDVATLVQRVVHESVAVKTGETVYIFGGLHALPLIENIVAECKATGANAFPIINSIKAERSDQVTNAAFKSGFLNKSKPFDSFNAAQVWIIVHPFIEDPETSHDKIADERLIQLASVEQEIYAEAARHHIRILRVSHPSGLLAESLKVNYDDYGKMIVKASIDDDTEVNWVSNNVNRLKGFLVAANHVRITTKSGTNFSFLVSKRPVIVNDGKITQEEKLSMKVFDKEASLPAWSIEVSVLETSAIGKVFIPRAKCDYNEMTAVSFNFNRGKIENFKAMEGGECFINKLAKREGPKDFIGSISFGFNPQLKAMDDNGVLIWLKETAGIIWVTIGGNEHLGGKNPVGCGQFSFPIIGATVEIDGKVILKGS